MIQRPKYGRKESFELVEKYLINRQGIQMLEIGMTRDTEGIGGDGHSTPFFAFLANLTNSKFTSIDISEENMKVCEKILQVYELLTPNVELIVADALQELTQWKKRIDFFYLDAWDYIKGEEEKSAQCHLQAFLLVEELINPDCLVLIDDILDHQSFEGKGKYLIPYLIHKNYELIYKGYQYLFRKPEAN